MPAAERETRTDPGKRDGAAARGRRDTGRSGFAAAKSFFVEAPAEGRLGVFHAALAPRGSQRSSGSTRPRPGELL